MRQVDPNFEIPEGYAAHHIVSSTDTRYPEMVEARQLLEEVGIDINAEENGVLLPLERGQPGTYHPSVHTRTNAINVRDALLPYRGDKAGMLRQLKKIKLQLLAGNWVY